LESYLRFRSKNLLLVLGLIFLIYGMSSVIFPDLDGVEKGVTIKMHMRGGKVSERYISPRSEDFVFSDRLPRYVTGAIITSEDCDFYVHKGINPSEMFEAAKYDISHFTLKQGGSTITQQVVKNIYLTGERTLSRKIVEAVTALRLEKKLSKKRILDYYINLIEFGNGVYGIRQASLYYFQKEPGNLTVKEAAILAVLMPKPKARGAALMVQEKDEFQKKRVTRLMAKMKDEGWV
jgi:membrane peptidoglycan carboxypeptidase